jgi:hypothetical protein
MDIGIRGTAVFLTSTADLVSPCAVFTGTFCEQSSVIPVTTISAGSILVIQKIIFYYSESGLGENRKPVYKL